MVPVRYTWMFRTAAVIYLLLGLTWVWRFGLTAYDPPHRIAGLVLGLLAAVVGVGLFRRARFAIALSAIGSAVVSISAAVFAPNAHGPVILFLATLAIICAVYAALAARVLFERAP
jgi:peptidoglycan/LPS O-acetylase OafA/YrhL